MPICLPVNNIICNDLGNKPTRVDKYLFFKFPDYSRSYFQKLIQDKKVYVNNIIINKRSYILKKEDIVTLSLQTSNLSLLTPHKIDFEIVDIQKDFLIINKPAGLIVHNTANKMNEPSLVRGLLHRFKEFNKLGDQERPGIVHRLDKDTSGLLIVARTIPAQIKLSEMFKNRSIQKTYLALVKGHPEHTGNITFPIGRHPIYRHKMSHKGIVSRSAQTYYDVCVFYENTSLIVAKPITGRTHQIRVHLAAIGHNIVGDTTYGQSSKLIKRQALHAWKLSFEFNKKLYEYILPIPKDFKNLLHSTFLSFIKHSYK
jgi:23S rRNA pseudouridine1911/1915/1917 synthase